MRKLLTLRWLPWALVSLYSIIIVAAFIDYAHCHGGFFNLCALGIFLLTIPWPYVFNFDSASVQQFHPIYTSLGLNLVLLFGLGTLLSLGVRTLLRRMGRAD